MFIQTEPTPNPASLKFLPGREVMTRGVLDFTDPDQTQSSPLARRLFEVEGVSGVFLGTDFITVTKTEGEDW
ncbi:MAG TPA: NifU N-terminal domain-containing protein, partial [Thermomicrobiales bacterium]|nr:NifU N-terminal domain-containing protein [Thermomicrobiales bacterium]